MSERSSAKGITRREFLGAAAGGVMVVAASEAAAGQAKGRTVVTFYCDDTAPYGHPPGTFKRFLDFCAAEGVAGECTALLASHWVGPPLSQSAGELDKEYIAQLRRAWDCGIGTHMELMTHDALFDFATGRLKDGLSHREGGPHEGVWWAEPEVSVETYQDYFAHILAEGERIGLRFSGVTSPGCACEVCLKRREEIRQLGAPEVNPNVWKALLNLVKEGKFRGHTVPCFITGNTTQAPALMAAEGQHRVYWLEPNAQDQLGIWTNTRERLSADYYITEDGARGRLAELIRAGEPRAHFYFHWQGMNPHDGVGWESFRTVVHRLHRHYAGQFVWRAPHQYTDSLA